MEFSVTKNGKELDKNLYAWDKKTRTFSTEENHLVLDFSNLDNCTFDTGSYCTFKTGSDCTFNTDSDCTFKTGSYCTFKTGSCCTFKTGSDCTFNTDSDCTFKTGSCCTFNTDSDCTFKTGSYCTFKTGSCCTFKTGSCCTFKTGSYCTFKTGSCCTFKTGSYCTFDTGSYCIFDTGSDCALVRRDVFEIFDISNKQITIAPYYIQGYVEDGYYYLDGEKKYPAIIADGILSEIINKKGNVYKVKNNGSDKITYLVKDGDIYSHGDTLKEAKESLIYKISNRDTTQYDNYTLDSELNFEDAIKMYRIITGACESGTRYFVENILTERKDKYSVKEIIDLTKSQYGNGTLIKFFKGVK